MPGSGLIGARTAAEQGTYGRDGGSIDSGGPSDSSVALERSVYPSVWSVCRFLLIEAVTQLGKNRSGGRVDSGDEGKDEKETHTSIRNDEGIPLSSPYRLRSFLGPV